MLPPSQDPAAAIRFDREPVWSSHHLLIPRPWKHWLLDRGSLTARLQALSGGQFAVRKLRQHWGRPSLSERWALGLRSTERAMIREVLLLGGGQPWVYARSILPASTLTGPLRALRQLDEKPLGALLFSSPAMRRGPIEVAPLQGGQLPEDVRAVFSEPAPLWGRRSVFSLFHKSLLVSEIFLPAFPINCHHKEW